MQKHDTEMLLLLCSISTLLHVYTLCPKISDTTTDKLV